MAEKRKGIIAGSGVFMSRLWDFIWNSMDMKS
ncbi:hypothetical protein HMPREF0988_01695 [Lachnospiraceae bacterium 1_4_56FAA]|nr:hypothetical protein HMPREF0988_01695 [Lachnospiraceae bacterium 1_4_56FAA]